MSIFEITAVTVPLAFVFGAVIGSFLNVLIWRLPRNEKPNGRSMCPHCKHELVWFDLIPLVSFIVYRGSCRYCHKPISIRYPIIEFITGLLFAFAIWNFPLVDTLAWLTFAKVAFVITICIVVFVIDFEHYLILDKVVFPAIFIILGLLIATDITAGTYNTLITAVMSAIGSAIPFWFLWWFSKGRWIGFGDVKLIIFMGLALGFPSIVVALFASFGLGAIIGIALILLGKKHMSSKLPFGTFLTVGTVLAIFYGPQIWTAYWKLLIP